MRVVPLSILGNLVADKLHLVPRVVAVQPDVFAGRGVAVAASVDQTSAEFKVEVDSVNALAIRACSTEHSESGVRVAYARHNTRTHTRGTGQPDAHCKVTRLGPCFRQ